MSSTANPMNLIEQKFENLEVRFVPHPEGKYAFGIVAVDLAKVLEITNSRDLAVDDEYKGVANIDTLGGTQSMVIIWEPGIYQVLAKSRKPQAKPFQKWVFEEVLPTIRKTGSYSTKPMSSEDLISQFNLPSNYIEALESLVVAEKQKLVLTKQLKSAEEVLDIYRTVLNEDACLTFKQLADAIAFKGLGRNNLIKFCRDEGFLVKNGEAVPYRKYVDNGCAIVVTSSYVAQGTTHTSQSTKLTFKGIAWILNSLRNKGYLINKTARKIWDTYNPITDELILIEAQREQLLSQ